MKTPFFGWVVVGCAFLVLFLAYGVQYSFGVFLPAMTDELGWQRASLGGAFSLYSLVYTGFSLVSGRLTDSLGPRRVIGLGGVLLGIGIMATSQISAQWQLYFFYGLVAALGMSTAYIPCNMTVVRWFHEKRGLALGVASCGASCGILVMPMLASYIIEHAGWRTGLLVLGAGLFIVTNIAAHFMVRSPEVLGLSPDGATASPSSGVPDAVAGADDLPGWTLIEARATITLWMFLFAFAIVLLTVTVPFVHIPNFARDIGLSATGGAFAISITGLFALLGSITLGALSDRIGRKRAMVFALCLQVAAFLIFLGADSAAALYFGAAAFGFFYGGIASLFPAFVGDLFGREHAGAIGGFIFGGAGILGAWGPAVAGYLRDTEGDYRFTFTLCALSALCALLLFLFLPGPRSQSRSRP
ncbi:MAG: MFS transporter [Rhodospirillaceae bacterium]|nr:MFS transporter [Rhodospirillaceae bacterium]